MKKLTVVLLVIAGLLSGCVAYEEPRGGHDHDEGYHNRDRDGNGVPDRDDRGRDNPNRN